MMFELEGGLSLPASPFGAMKNTHKLEATLFLLLLKLSSFFLFCVLLGGKKKEKYRTTVTPTYYFSLAVLSIYSLVISRGSFVF
ncbi:hypothetical protein J3E69DRAFT_348887 [Trichoderma sp. SZMC 28015]